MSKLSDSGGLQQEVQLRDPVLAAFLAWLVPGLGHIYQGRTAKGILFSVCILGTFLYGVYLGGNKEIGWGRVVYVSWRPGDKRLSYFAQVCTGVVALPAILQASRIKQGKTPLLNYFMAPAPLENDPNDPLDESPPYTLSTIHKRLGRLFEIATAYTVIAGLLNLLAIYDAFAGPVLPEEEKPLGEKEEQPDAA